MYVKSKIYTFCWYTKDPVTQKHTSEVAAKTFPKSQLVSSMTLLNESNWQQFGVMLVVFSVNATN